MYKLIIDNSEKGIAIMANEHNQLASAYVSGKHYDLVGFRPLDGNGRQLRVPLAFPRQNELIESFEYRGERITNFEMESSALAGLSALMGHKAVTVCLVIANRLAKEANIDYGAKMNELIQTVLERI